MRLERITVAKANVETVVRTMWNVAHFAWTAAHVAGGVAELHVAI